MRRVADQDEKHELLNAPASCIRTSRLTHETRIEMELAIFDNRLWPASLRGRMADTSSARSATRCRRRFEPSRTPSADFHTHPTMSGVNSFSRSTQLTQRWPFLVRRQGLSAGRGNARALARLARGGCGVQRQPAACRYLVSLSRSGRQALPTVRERLPACYYRHTCFIAPRSVRRSPPDSTRRERYGRILICSMMDTGVASLDRL
jgi:hypothetical protein